MFDFIKNKNEAETTLQGEVDTLELDASMASEQVAEEAGSEAELPSDKICDLVDYVVSGIIDYPDELQLEVTDSENSTLIEIRANKSDCGKIIGKQGRTIKALRVLSRALASRLGLSVDIQLLD